MNGLFLMNGSVFAGNSYSVEIRGADLNDVIRMLARLDSKNVVLPAKLEGVVTASFESVSLSEALDAILKTHGLGSVATGNIIHIATIQDLEAEGHDLITHTFQLKYAKSELIGTQVEALLSERGSSMVDKRTNSVTVRDTNVKLADITKFLDSIDTKDSQVLIEAKVIEASNDFIRNVGLQWGVTDTTGKVKIAGPSDVGTGDTGRNFMFNSAAKGLAGIAPVSGIALALGSFASTLTDVQLTAAEERGDLTILSRPAIITVNNQPAKIHSGVTFYIKTSGDVSIGSSSSSTTASTSGSSNLQEITAGITMIVTPQITSDHKIILSIDVTESQADFSATVDGIPSIIDNTANTTVVLNNGETTVIGGLFQVKKTVSKRGVPVLNRVPLFGALFRQTSKARSKKELIIFIKPSIVEQTLAQLPRYPEDEQLLKDTKKKDKKKTKETKDIGDLTKDEISEMKP